MGEPEDFAHRPGTLGYRDDLGDWHVAVPGSPMFSIVTMLATHYYNENHEWEQIYTSDEDL